MLKTDAGDGTDTTLALGSARFSIIRDRGGSLLELTYYLNAFTMDAATGSVSWSAFLDARYLELEEGDEIYVKYDIGGNITSTSLPYQFQFGCAGSGDTSCTFNVIPLRWYGVGSTVDVATLMPEVDILTFIKDILVWFNIEVFYKNETKQVIFWHQKFDTVINWDKKVLRDKEIRRVMPESAKWTYKFKDDDDDAQILSEYSYGEGDEKTITINFSDTGEQYLPNGIFNIWKGERTLYAALTTPEYRYEFKTDAGLRIMYYAGEVDYDYYADSDYTLTCSTPGFIYTSVYNTKTTLPGFFTTRKNLLFENVDFQLTGTLSEFQEGIFDGYHRKMIESVDGGEQMTCVLLLDSADILGMVNMTEGKDWRTAVHIDGKNYRVLELEQLDGNIYKGRFQEVYL
jgi:hypothetical protein